jgi:hypothetical protein
MVAQNRHTRLAILLFPLLLKFSNSSLMEATNINNRVSCIKYGAYILFGASNGYCQQQCVVKLIVCIFSLIIIEKHVRSLPVTVAETN